MIKEYYRKTFIYPIVKKIRGRIFSNNPVKFTKKIFFKRMSMQLDLDSPKLFSEKIQYLKLFVYPKDLKVVQAADKASLNTYLEGLGLEKFSVPHIKVLSNPEELNLNQLPSQFVIKKSNASGYNMIVLDKSSISERSLKKTLKMWSKLDYGLQNGETWYSRAQSQFVVEPYLGSFDVEYKFFVFNGILRVTQRINYRMKSDYKSPNILNNKEADLAKMEFLDVEKFRQRLSAQERPLMTNMIRNAELIGKDFPFVRVDYLVVNGEVYIGELTFAPTGGFNNYLTKRQQIEWGNYLHI